jgi:exosortase/archaeosortase family protein
MIARTRPAETRGPQTRAGVVLPSSSPSTRERAAGLLATAGKATPVWRAAAVVLCVVAAYYYSLQTLIQEMGQQTPLAYLGLIPPIALLLAVVLSRPRRGEPDVHDRYLDYIVGVPLLTLAMVLLIFAPGAVPSLYWLHRLDLLSLPLFVAGAIALAFGVRALLRVRAAVAFLFLAWPYPYVLLVDHQLSWFTDATAAAVKAMLHLVPVATVQINGDFLVSHATGVSKTFTVSVTSACSGVDSGLGFLIVGGAAAILMRGRRWRKLLWLAAGAALMFAVNVVRILLVLGAGRLLGEQFAIDVLHPVLGLVLILGATLVMLLLLPRFHLSLKLPAIRRSTPSGTPAVTRTLAVRQARIPLIVIAGASVAAVFANSGMSRYELLSFGLGPSRLSPGTVTSAPVAGWTLTASASYAWAPRFFGSDGTWTRYAYVETSLPSNSAAPAAVTVDVIGTADLGTFSTYGLEACYGFHNYELLDIREVDLGGGLNGKVLRYVIPGSGYWLGLYWEWPVSVPGNERYQRVVLSVDSSLTSNEPNQQRLIGLARELVQQAARVASAAGPGVF